MVLAPMVLLCLGLSRGPSQDEQPIAAAPVSSTDAPVLSAVLRTASRPIYPYSVIRGGAYSAQELDRALAGDPLASAHYAGFDRARARMTRAQPGQLLYASYRVHDQIYWTRRPMRLTLHEALLTDGEHLARARCGNRLSPTPQAPVGPEVGLDVPEVGNPDPVDIFSDPMLRHEVFPGLLESHWFKASESGAGDAVAENPSVRELPGGGIGADYAGFSLPGVTWASGPPPNPTTHPFVAPVSGAMPPIDYVIPIAHGPGPGFVNGTQLPPVTTQPTAQVWGSTQPHIMPPAGTYTAFAFPGWPAPFPTVSWLSLSGQAPHNGVSTQGLHSTTAPPAGVVPAPPDPSLDPADPAVGDPALPPPFVIGVAAPLNNTPEPSTALLFTG